MNTETSLVKVDAPLLGQSRLPLWKNVVEELERDGIRYGQVITAEWLEPRLKTNRDTLEFAMAVSRIRLELEHLGFYLSGRGGKGNLFAILTPEKNVEIGVARQREAAAALRRGVTLLAHTDTTTLAEWQVKKHNSTLERLQIKTALLARCKSIAKFLKP